jgi:hypothetical protein
VLTTVQELQVGALGAESASQRALRNRLAGADDFGANG